MGYTTYVTRSRRCTFAHVLACALLAFSFHHHRRRCRRHRAKGERKSIGVLLGNYYLHARTRRLRRRAQFAGGRHAGSIARYNIITERVERARYYSCARVNRRKIIKT